jgi:ubiquinol-cytochrome c reductase cytochrome c1 subunit
MKMKMFKAIAAAALTTVALSTGALAESKQKTAKDVSYSFEGAFGTFDRDQLQRGYKVYREVCSACHSMKFISFRNLEEIGIFDDEQTKAHAATFTVKDGPNDAGEMFERPGLPSDRFPSPYESEEAARASNGGAYPPDLSLITRSRPGWYGTINQFVNGIGGPEYVYSVLTGYDEKHEGEAGPEGKYYNPYFGAGPWIGMGAPLADGVVTFDDGSPNDLNSLAKDVSAFLAWTAEPHMESRKQTGFMVMLYLALLTVMMYFVKKRVWKDVH